MKTSMSLVPRKSRLAFALCGCVLWLACSATSLGQSNSASSGKLPEKKQDMTVRVAVDEVRIDAVVLNWRGRQITDLSADDFEIYQDGKRQEIVSCTYVNDYVPPGERKASLISTTAPSREDIRRTILFLVDDFSMSFENIHHTRMGLKNFVKKQMQPGDLVGIIQTSLGFGQLFNSDKRQLLATIEKIQWGAPHTLANCGPEG
jgi:VWFA-related protein